jgi:hypothetical protein
MSYSEREGTLAGGKMEDDVTGMKLKARRLQEIVDLTTKTCLGKIRGIHWLKP